MEDQIKDLLQQLETKDLHIRKKNENLQASQKRHNDVLLQYKMKLNDTKQELEQEKHTTKELSSEIQEYKCDIERYNELVAKLQEEAQREWRRTEQYQGQLEEALETIHTLRGEIEIRDNSMKKKHTIMELKLTNKISMLEKKCVYLNKMCEYSGSGDSDAAHTLISEQLLHLMKENESLMDEFHALQNMMEEKDRQVKEGNEKVRQMKDLLSASHMQEIDSVRQEKQQLDEEREQIAEQLQSQKQPITGRQSAAIARKQRHLIQKKKILKRESTTLAANLRDMVAEKCLDEILLECAIDNIMPSNLDPRGKTTAILRCMHEKFQEMETLYRKIHLQEETLSSMSKKQDPHSAGNNYRWYTAFKSLLDMLHQVSKSNFDQHESIIENKENDHHENGEGENKEAEQSEEGETSLHDAKEIILRASTLVKQLMEDIVQMSTARQNHCEDGTQVEIEKLRTEMAQLLEKNGQLEQRLSETNIEQLRDELSLAKKQLADALNTCVIYKNLIQEFTELEEQEMSRSSPRSVSPTSSKTCNDDAFEPSNRPRRSNTPLMKRTANKNQIETDVRQPQQGESSIQGTKRKSVRHPSPTILNSRPGISNESSGQISSYVHRFRQMQRSTRQ